MGIGRMAGDALRFGRRVTETATREVNQARRQVTTQVQAVTRQVTSAASERARDGFEGVKRTGGALRDTATHTLRDVAGGVARTTRNAVTEGRDRVQDTVSAARDFTGAARDKAEDTFEAGQALVRRTANDVGQTVNETARRTGPALLQGLATAVQQNPVVAGTRALIDDFSLDRQVDRLQPGSSISIGSYVEGNIKAFAGKTEGALEVRRSEEPGGGYTVSTSSELGAGLAVKMGLKVGGEASVGAEAFRTRGTTVEFHFATAEEAKRAANIIQDFNSDMALRRTLNTSMPLAGLVANHLLGAPGEDFASLTPHIRAVEYEVGTELSGELELELGAASGDLGLGGNKTTTARIEMEGGRPQRMTLTRSFEVNFNGGASAGPDIRVRGTSLSGPTNLSIGGDRTLKVSMEQSVDIPEGLASAGRMPTSVDATRLAMRLGVAETREARLTVTDSARGNGAALDVNGEAGDEVKLEFRGNIHDIRTSGALESLARGRPGQALGQLRGKVHMSATVQESRTYSRDLGLGVRAGLIGAEGGFVAERTSVGAERNFNMAGLIGFYLTRR